MLAESLNIVLYNQKVNKLYNLKSETITKKYGLHKIEFEILYFLHTTCLNRAKDIAQNTYFSKAHISNAIESLSKNGYLVCIHDSTDKRCIRLKLTDKATDIIKEIQSFYQHMIKIMFNGVSEEEKISLERILKKMSNNMNDEFFNKIDTQKRR
ncbi:MAG: winged helix-turn-helix transcriptional regulator [Ruminococcus sp.]|nr:winged helix-turn-helix transcriptional regulator [Ruminococcus sp.]